MLTTLNIYFVIMKNIVLLFLLIIQEAFNLTNVNLIFPKYVKEGENTTLICTYDLEGDELYSVKWYRGKYEFYRYLPRDNPKTQVHPLPGFNVDLSSSNSNRVTLLNVPRYLRGNYSCEVSGEAPAFISKRVTEYLEVISGSESNQMANFELEGNEHHNLMESVAKNKSNVICNSLIMLIILVTMRHYF